MCEDFWHLRVPQLLALDGAQILVNVSSSPGRDLAATNEVGLGTATSWRTLMRTYAQLTTSFVVFVNRVGVEESITFWGGSEVIGPDGAALFSAPVLRRRAVPGRGRPGRGPPRPDQLPLLRDERPELEVRELARIVAERAGLAIDATADDDAEAGLDVAPAGGAGPQIGPAPTSPLAGRRAPRFGLPRRPVDRRSCIDGVARRVIVGFIQGQLRQAGFERAVLGLSGGIDSALVAYLVAEAIGAERLLCVMMPYRTSSPASRADAEEVVRRLGCASELIDISPMVDGYFGTETAPGTLGAEASPPAPCAGATSWPGCGWRSCTTAR